MNGMDWNLLLGQMGWSGILAAALVYVFRSYVEELNDRIDELEKRAGACEADRAALHKEITNILKKSS